MKLHYLLALLFLCLGTEISVAKQFATGLVIPQNWKLGAHFSRGILGVDVPASFDWRKKVAVVPAIKNQGQCGSCWAHATVEVEEWLIAIADKKLEVLSPQELVSCDTNGSQGCSGGYFTAFDYEKQKGLTYEKDFPYKAADTRCDVSALPHDYRIFDWGYVGSEQTAPTADQVKAQLVAGGPLAVGVCADNKFMNYKSGVFSGKAKCLNHMTVLVGYDDATQSWIMQNSWGTSWGQKGYMNIKYGSNSIASITAYAVYKH